ncbi:hypothetical protein H8356DRAFT_1749386 [Neocallimastix lanati (nom. inval.)]|nr:hypothetical protein H8356DRAFT_1749386 [Neocallimastix sp. JGI-2020a]
MNITCGHIISQDRNLIRLFGAMPRIRTPPSTVTWVRCFKKWKNSNRIISDLLKDISRCRRHV